MFTDLMIDLETLGCSAGAVFTQMGLCAFDAVPSGDNEMATRDIRVDIDDALQSGLRVDASTLRYWLMEKEAARREMAEPRGVSLVNAMLNLRSFVLGNSYTGVLAGGSKTLQRVWGYGPSFDIAILDVASVLTGVELPWGHREVRCVRTLKELYPGAERPEPRVAHVGVHDSVAQALWVQNMWRLHLATKEKTDDGTSRDPEGGNGVRLRVREEDLLLHRPSGAPEVDQAQDGQEGSASDQTDNS